MKISILKRSSTERRIHLPEEYLKIRDDPIVYLPTSGKRNHFHQKDFRPLGGYFSQIKHEIFSFCLTSR